MLDATQDMLMAKTRVARKPPKKKDRGGRPPLPPSERRTLELTIPVSPGELKRLRDFAKRYNQATATWARTKLLHQEDGDDDEDDGS